MKATIKNKDNMWVVYVDGEYKGTLDTSTDALQVAYDMGCDEFDVHYSSQRMRKFGRDSLENFNLVK